LQATWPDQYAQAHGGDLGIRVGDILQFWDRPAGVLMAAPAVVSVQHTPTFLVVPGGGASDSGGDTEPCGTYASCTLVALSSSVPAGIVPATAGRPYAALTQVFNANRTAGQLVFRHNTVRNGRRVGVLAKGHR